MDELRKMEIKDEIEQGNYLVDVQKVADAILTRLRELAAARSEAALPPERPAPRATS